MLLVLWKFGLDLTIACSGVAGVRRIEAVGSYQSSGLRRVLVFPRRSDGVEESRHQPNSTVR